MSSVLRLSMALVLLGCARTPKAPKVAAQAAWATDFAAADWLSEWQPKPTGRFGLDNLSIREEPRAPFAHFLRVEYPKGVWSPSASRAAGLGEGGGQFYGTLACGPVEHAFVRYFVRFEPNFDFVKGGKLPGFYGGTQVSGGHIPDGTDGFSTRFMWRAAGQGEIYAYLPSS
jgi:hypothetical protein